MVTTDTGAASASAAGGANGVAYPKPGTAAAAPYKPAGANDRYTDLEVSEAKLDRKTKIVEELYRPDEIVTAVIPVKHGATQEIASILRTLVGDPHTGSGSSLSIAPVKGDVALHTNVTEAARRLRLRLTDIADQRGGSARSDRPNACRSALVPRARARRKQSGLIPLIRPPRSPRVVPHAETDALLVTAEPEQLKQILMLLRQIDVPERHVKQP